MAGHQFDGKIRRDEGDGQKPKGNGDLRQHQKRGAAAYAHHGRIVFDGAHHGQKSHDNGTAKRKRQGEMSNFSDSNHQIPLFESGLQFHFVIPL